MQLHDDQVCQEAIKGRVGDIGGTIDGQKSDPRGGGE